MKPYIIEYLFEQPHKAIIIGLSYESPVIYLDNISEELGNKLIIGNIVFDVLLHSGNGKNRFFEIYFDGKNFDDSSTRVIKLERSTFLRKKICEILFKNFEYVESSILNKYQKELIKRGCCI